VRRAEYTVAPELIGTRLDRFLAGMADGLTRARVRRLIEQGHVLVDGVVRKAAMPVRAGMRIEVNIVDPEPLEVEAEDIPLDVLYMDDDIVVVDKPAGMVVHPGSGRRTGTLVNALLYRFHALSAAAGAERPGIVHRLDKDTSGVMVVARTVEAHEGLARQFRMRTIEKRYLGLARGRVARTRGELTWSVGRHQRERTRMSVASRRGRAAHTEYVVVERLPGATLLELRPRTGRTHQLRVHLSALGHPLVGDRIYGERRNARRARSEADRVLASCGRQALHATMLGFAHPRDGRAMRFEAPLPPDLRAVVGALRELAAPEKPHAG